jgi:hypothetical protein
MRLVQQQHLLQLGQGWGQPQQQLRRTATHIMPAADCELYPRDVRELQWKWEGTRNNVNKVAMLPQVCR